MMKWEVVKGPDPQWLWQIIRIIMLLLLAAGILMVISFVLIGGSPTIMKRIITCLFGLVITVMALGHLVYRWPAVSRTLFLKFPQNHPIAYNLFWLGFLLLGCLTIYQGLFSTRM